MRATPRSVLRLGRRPFDYFTEPLSLGRGKTALATTHFQQQETGATAVTTRVVPENGRVGWLTTGLRFRRRLESRYARLAALMSAHIPESKRLPVTPAAPAPDRSVDG